MNGDVEWLCDDFYMLQLFVCKYLNFYCYKVIGLFYWEIDEVIGVDNDFSIFYCFQGSLGFIFLNVLMYCELQVMVYLVGCLNLDDIVVFFEKEVVVLKGKV